MYRGSRGVDTLYATVGDTRAVRAQDRKKVNAKPKGTDQSGDNPPRPRKEFKLPKLL